MTRLGQRNRVQLHALARSEGIEVRWRAQNGSTQTCSDETIVAVLQMLHVDIEHPDDAPRARSERQRRRDATLVEPVVVAWDGVPPVVAVRLPAGSADTDFTIVVTTDTGETSSCSRRKLALKTTKAAAAAETVTVAATLPRGFAPGRHRLVVETPIGTAESTLLAAPSRLTAAGTTAVTTAARTRAWGLFAPVYALHSSDRPGVGDLATLEQLARWMAARGGTVVGTLPLLAMFAGHGKEPREPSPYAPVSRRYWNELYLDLDALPELSGSAPLAARFPVGASRLLDLPALAQARRPVLEGAVAGLAQSPARQAELDRWLDEHPDTRAYARFRAESEGSGRDGAALHEYAQWAMSTQLGNLAEVLDGRGQSLYTDLPVGAHRDGYDVASRPELFLADASVGAPPDAFQPGGQDWGFPPLDPAAGRVDGHAYLASCFDAQLRYARLLRVDHVMGLHRLWMIPADAPAADGAYVHYPAEEQWATILLAASQHGAQIVGENLGTVPAETNRSMKRHRALGMWVTEFEIPDNEAVAVSPPGSSVLACINTHDLATFAAWWRELAPAPRAALLRTLRAAGDLEPNADQPDAVLAATLAWLGRSRSPLVLAALEDLWLEPNPQNIPGAGHEDVAFRQRAAHSIDELDDLPSVTRALDRLDFARRNKR